MKLPENFDKTEFAVRFGCGGLIGALFGFGFAVQAAYETLGGYAAATLFFVVFYGLLAVRYGDSFWGNFGR